MRRTVATTNLTVTVDDNADEDECDWTLHISYSGDTLRVALRDEEGNTLGDIVEVEP